MTLRLTPLHSVLVAFLLLALAGLAACGETATALPPAVPAPVGTVGGNAPAAVATNAAPAALSTSLANPVDNALPPYISKEEVRTLLDQQAVLLLDVRALEYYQYGHIKGAISFPFETLDKHYTELPKDKLLVTYCSCPEDEESIGAAAQLHVRGFSYDTLKVLQGGTIAWQAAGWPMEGTDFSTPSGPAGGGAPVPATP